MYVFITNYNIRSKNLGMHSLPGAISKTVGTKTAKK